VTSSPDGAFSTGFRAASRHKNAGIEPGGKIVPRGERLSIRLFGSPAILLRDLPPFPGNGISLASPPAPWTL